MDNIMDGDNYKQIVVSPKLVVIDLGNGARIRFESESEVTEFKVLEPV